MKRRLLAVVVVLAALAVPALPALARSYWISDAQVDIEVNSDGSLTVTEILSYSFDGSFSGAYRDIRVRGGEEVEVIAVGDEDGPYSPGGCTTLGCSSPPGTYGVEKIPGYVRVVWHHQSNDEVRNFVIRYRFEGLAVAYDDVVDVNLQVWGDKWSVGVDRLSARMTIPPGAQADEVRVWGHPQGIDGETSLGADRISPTLQARGIPPERWVEFRVVFPRRLLTSTDGATVVSGNGLGPIVEEEMRWANEDQIQREARRQGVIYGLATALALSLGLGGLVYLRFGREPKVAYDREYEQEPPTDLTPAEVGALLSQGYVNENEFTATLFDLIRRKHIVAVPTQVERSTWAGLRRETISDLMLSLGDGGDDPLRDFEQSVMTVMKRVLADGPQPLHEFRKLIREDASANASTYQTFRSRAIGAVRRAGLLNTTGSGVAALVILGVIVLVFGTFFLLPRVMGDPVTCSIIPVSIVFGMVI